MYVTCELCFDDSDVFDEIEEEEPEINICRWKMNPHTSILHIFTALCKEWWRREVIKRREDVEW